MRLDWSFFGQCLYLLLLFDGSLFAPQFVESYTWLPSLGVKVLLGVDGLSLFLVVLTGFVALLVLFYSAFVEKRPCGAFPGLVLLLASGILGSLLSFDLLLFYLFWEAMLIPMYFMIGCWGGAGRIFATTKFILYTFFASLLMLLAFVWLYLGHYADFGFYSTSLLDLYRMKGLGIELQLLLFAAFFFAFAVKMPIWPFHTWLPYAHTEAPTEGSVLLAAVLLKLGCYGFLRIALPLFPQAAELCAPFILGLGILGIVAGAASAFMQEDAKKLIAYSSISHLGFIVLGSFAFAVDGSLSKTALSGAVFQMIHHGLSAAALFVLVGCLYRRKGSRLLCDFGGFAKTLPVFSSCLILATLGAIGLPGTGGFVGEFLILAGTFTDYPFVSILACSGVLFSAVYMLSLCKKTIFGPLSEENKKLPDLTRSELMVVAPLVILIVVTGLFPFLILDRVEASISHLSVHVQEYRLGSEESAHAKLGVNLQFDEEQVERPGIGMLRRNRPVSLGSLRAGSEPLTCMRRENVR